MPANRRLLRSGLFVGTIFFIGAIAGVVAFEVYHRATLLDRIPERVNGAAMWIQSQTLSHSPVDDHLGRKSQEHPRGLFKINTAIDIAVAHPTAGILNFSVRTNNVGLLSDHDYVFERDPARPEYRIAVLGDSFTGPTTATYQWVDTVEELLNSSPRLRATVGGKEFKVYDFGWVGAGFQTFAQEWLRSARHFSPDLVAINYLNLDFPRTDDGHLTDDKAIIGHAVLNLRKILDAQPNTVLALMPNYNELMDGKSDARLTEMLVQAAPGLKVETMLKRLPTHLGKSEMELWFSVPHDAHMSDRGGEIYARVFAAWLAERIAGERIDFSKTPTKHWNLDPGAPRVRKIQNSLSRIADRPEVVRKIKDAIIDQEIRGKVYTLYPYVFHILASGSDGLTVPSAKSMVGGFTPISYRAGFEDVVYLYLACIAPPVSLLNPRCYHFQHVFVK